MDIFSLITLAGGVAFFLYGMHVMSNGLEKMAGGKLERTLKQMTSSPIRGLLLGAGITIAIQSSSAMTVMLVGLVNSGIMQLRQTICIIMGSNIGTTLTAWLLSLVGVESSNIFIRLLKPESFSPVLALIGVVLIMTSKRTRRKDAGGILVGFSLLMFGMTLMSNAVSPLADMPEFSQILVAFKNPLLGVLVGALFTGIIQSSAASVGILQALSLTGDITVGMALPIIMGQNIGTCVTALLSSIGVNRNAKRVAAVHISFNIIGTFAFLLLFFGANAIFNFTFIEQSISPLGIAVCHTIFNVITTAMLLPFTRQLENLAMLLVPGNPEDETYAFLDERLLNSPSFAIAECNSMTARMAELAKSTLFAAIRMLEHYDEKTVAYVTESEDKLDMFEDKLGTFLVKIASKNLSDPDSHEISKLLHVIGDFERVGDHALNILDVASEMHEKKIHFSEDASEETALLTNALTEIIDLAFRSFTKNDVQLASQVEPLEQVIDDLIEQIKIRHVERLQSGVCTIELGFVLSDLLNNYERVSDHCSNIAVCVIEIAQDSFDTHAYLQGVKRPGNEEFRESFRQYSQKYKLS